MGRRGPAPHPTALRLINGDPKALAALANEPQPVDELPQAPRMSAEVREVWDYTVKQLDHMRLAKAADRDALHCYCVAVVNHRKAAAILAESPVLIKGALGGLVRNPALAVARDAAYTVRSFAQEFGLTPSARTRVDARSGEADDSGNPFAQNG